MDRIIDLELRDMYADKQIPEEAIEECLKVLRTLECVATINGFISLRALMGSAIETIESYVIDHNQEVKRAEDSKTEAWRQVQEGSHKIGPFKSG